MSEELNNDDPELFKPDDGIREVLESADGKEGCENFKKILAGFTLVATDALEKLPLEEALIEPNGSSTCACNSVCTCVPVNACSCNTVCSCNAVDVCGSNCSCVGDCCVGAYYAPCW
jgi:hypothetical protein